MKRIVYVEKSNGNFWFRKSVGSFPQSFSNSFHKPLSHTFKPHKTTRIFFFGTFELHRYIISQNRGAEESLLSYFHIQTKRVPRVRTLLTLRIIFHPLPFWFEPPPCSLLLSFPLVKHSFFLIISSRSIRSEVRSSRHRSLQTALLAHNTLFFILVFSYLTTFDLIRNRYYIIQ